MDGNGAQNPTGGGPPPKPWERSGSSSGPGPFKPPSAGNTSDVVEASGTANPGEIVSTSDRNGGVNTNALGKPLPPRPWENTAASNSYGGYGSGMNYNSTYGSGGLGGGMYGSSYGGGGMYGSGGMYGGSSMYNRGGYGGGGLYGSSSLGGGMYGGSYGGGMGGYGMGGMGGMGMGGMGGMGMGGPYGGPQDPNNPYGEPSAPPGFWISFLRVMQGVVSFFGRISILVDQNTQAVHFFMSALLQLFDRGGMLYGELARFAMRLLGVKTRPPKLQGPQGPNRLPGPPQMQALEGPKPAPAWDNVWGNDVSK